MRVAKPCTDKSKALEKPQEDLQRQDDEDYRNHSKSREFSGEY
jgi:hypothetical protein